MAGTDLEVRDPSELEDLLFEGPEVEVTDDPVEIQREILQRIFSTETPQQLAQVAQATPWQELMGVPVEVRDIRLRKSSFDQGAKVFAVADAVILDTGEAITLTCSGMNVLGMLMQHKRMGWLPYRWKLERNERETASGYHVLWLNSGGLDNPEFPLPKKKGE